MAHFYGGIQGTRGDATRQGSKDSGMRVYAQSYDSRVTVDYQCYRPGDEDERNIAHIAISGGWTTYYRTRSISFNVDKVAEALDRNDPKVNAIWDRIVKDFGRLDVEADKALKRIARMEKRTATNA